MLRAAALMGADPCCVPSVPWPASGTEALGLFLGLCAALGSEAASRWGGKGFAVSEKQLVPQTLPACCVLSTGSVRMWVHACIFVNVLPPPSKDGLYVLEKLPLMLGVLGSKLDQCHNAESLTIVTFTFLSGFCSVLII